MRFLPLESSGGKGEGLLVANVMLEPAYCEKGRGVARDDDDDDRGPSRCFLRLEVVVAEGELEPAVL